MEMVEVKTADLLGPALDWATAKASETKIDDSRGKELRIDISPGFQSPWMPSVNWHQGGPLIDLHKPWLSPPVGTDECDEPYGWDAEIQSDDGSSWISHIIGAPTALVAACRAIVVAKLGDTVSVPKELIQ